MFHKGRNQLGERWKLVANPVGNPGFQLVANLPTSFQLVRLVGCSFK